MPHAAFHLHLTAIDTHQVQKSKLFITPKCTCGKPKSCSIEEIICSIFLQTEDKTKCSSKEKKDKKPFPENAESHEDQRDCQGSDL